MYMNRISHQRRMIRLHVIDDQIVERPVSHGLIYICKKLVFETVFDSIDKSNLLIDLFHIESF